MTDFDLRPIAMGFGQAINSRPRTFNPDHEKSLVEQFQLWSSLTSIIKPDSEGQVPTSKVVDLITAAYQASEIDHIPARVEDALLCRGKNIGRSGFYSVVRKPASRLSIIKTYLRSADSKYNQRAVDPAAILGEQ
jgi:hypothetical protein